MKEKQKEQNKTINVNNKKKVKAASKVDRKGMEQYKSCLKKKHVHTKGLAQEKQKNNTNATEES